jgi:predicted Holliday junction resolvase-like endonuclease
MWWLLIGLAIGVLVAFYFRLAYQRDLEKSRRELQEQYQGTMREAQQRAEEFWKAQFEDWKSREIETVKLSMEQQYKALFEQWKLNEEEQIRSDATKRSKSVMLGQITEHLVPFLPEFKYNPKDARFLGTPVDLIVFDGLSDGDLKQVVFIEVKSGTSRQLTQREKQVRDALLEKRVSWELFYKPAELLTTDDTEQDSTVPSSQFGSQFPSETTEQ